MPSKPRTYVCTGCSIGECLNANRLAEVSEGELGVPSTVHGPLCVPEGLDFLRKDIQDHGTDQAVIVACSHRVNWDVFSTESLGVETVERVNVREGVAWSKPPQEEETQALAEDYVRMGIARAQKTNVAPPKLEPTLRSLLVVGGGISGLTASLEASAAGSEVVLVEKEASLGGWLSRLHKLYPTRAPYGELQDTAIQELAERVQNERRVQVMTSTEVQSISGKPGNFAVVLNHEGETSEIGAGAVVMATGWQPHESSQQEDMGLGRDANVVDSITMEELASRGTIRRPSDRKAVESVAFVQRADNAFSFGSGISDLVALKQALYVSEQNPGALAYIIYDNMVTPGLMELFYREVQEHPGVVLTKAEVAEVREGDRGDLVLDLKNSLIGGDLKIQVNMLVLSRGMAPSTAAEDVLHLEYLQGPQIPLNQHGFADSNFICFPYETRRTGIYAAGCVREPMDADAAAEDATGAALKAMQSLELISQGEAVHPRSRDLSLPFTLLQGCTQCGRCTEECPFGAIELDERRYPTLNSSRCRRCGICMGACPVRVISFDDYSVEQLSSMVRAIKFPEDESIPRVIAFACENDAHPAIDMAGINRLQSDASVRVVPLRCLGSLNIVLVTDALSEGVDGVLLLGCKTGDDYQCHFIHGSELATRRLANIQETLTRLMLEPERVKMVELEITDYNQVPDLVSEFVEQLKAIGPNPYKGFI